MINRENITQQYNENKKMVAAGTLFFLIVAVAPLFFRQSFETLEFASYPRFKFVLAALPLLTLLFCYKQFVMDLSVRTRRSLLILIAVLSLLLVDIHAVYIDEPGNFSSQYFDSGSNAEWQQSLHHNILELSNQVIPHSYRFLPNCLLNFFLMFTDDFQFSTYIFRVIFMILLLYSIYYYGSLYYQHETALLAIMFYGIAYQISIRFYAGQITDPVSHLCFILSFIFLELDLFIYFALSILVGCLAKESIMAMAVYYLMQSFWRRKNLLRAFILLFFSFAEFIGVRLYVSREVQYKSISGVGLGHVLVNLSQPNWVRQILFTVGIFLPFVLLSYRDCNINVRNLVFFLLPTLLISNLFFSWMSETRNLIPVLIPMALMTAHYLQNYSSDMPA